jgi:hypothetical protein
MDTRTKLAIIVIVMASGLIGFEIMETTGVLHTALAGCEKGRSFNNALSHSHGQCLKL